MGLHVLFKRSDGYHELDTVMIELPIFDALEITPSAVDSFTSSGLTIPGEGNLCVDALQLFRQSIPVPPVQMHLVKKIPMGGGMGGGSSDASFVLKNLAMQFAPDLSSTQLEEISAQLGSDCPFFIRGGWQVCGGRGELLTPIEPILENCWVVVINCGIHISTPSAFQELVPDASRKSVFEILQMPVSDWKAHLVNDFETTVFQKYPVLKELKEALYTQGAFYAAMSGSGSTLFGLFQEEPKALHFETTLEFSKVVQLVKT